MRRGVGEVGPILPLYTISLVISKDTDCYCNITRHNDDVNVLYHLNLGPPASVSSVDIGFSLNMKIVMQVSKQVVYCLLWIVRMEHRACSVWIGYQIHFEWPKVQINIIVWTFVVMTNGIISTIPQRLSCLCDYPSPKVIQRLASTTGFLHCHVYILVNPRAWYNVAWSVFILYYYYPL